MCNHGVGRGALPRAKPEGLNTKFLACLCTVEKELATGDSSLQNWTLYCCYTVKILWISMRIASGDANSPSRPGLGVGPGQGLASPDAMSMRINNTSMMCRREPLN